MQSCYLAVDIGASSGRHIVGTVRDGRMTLTEVYRFENHLVRQNGHLCWAVEELEQNVLAGMRACRDAGYAPVSMGIDTWAVDYVLVDAAGRRVGDAVAYRDERTAAMRQALEPLVPFEELYTKTGIQYQPFNTVYQLMALKAEHPEQLAQAAAFLMIPDYLHYRLTGVLANEYTNASTTALVNAEQRVWDEELIARLGLPRGIFQPIRPAGSVLGRLRPEVAAQVGFDCTVILPATHDTGSAFLAVPARDGSAVTLSSGTWSLLGVENKAPITTPESAAANFTNEGGYAFRYRYLKNIMGLWMLQSIRRELNGTAYIRQGEAPAAAQKQWSFPDLIEAARAESGFAAVVDADDPRFLSPESMSREVKAACAESGQPVPANVGQLVQCVYNSLSQDYRRAVETLQRLTGRTYTSINIVGGGSQDMYLNQLTANATGLPVFAGPTEGTALGNLMVQFIANGEYPDLQAARDAIKTSFEIKEVPVC